MWRKSNLSKYINILKSFYYKESFIPSFAWALGLFWLSSKASVHKIFKKLLDLWYLKRNWDKFIAWEALLSIPMFESISAWFPSPGSEENKFDINIQDYLIQKPNSTILLRVKWDSMIDEWIKQGDLVIVDKSLQAKVNDIVIAVVDWDYTMKYFSKDAKWRICLKAANSKYKDIYPREELEIFGVVSGVVRKYRG